MRATFAFLLAGLLVSPALIAQSPVIRHDQSYGVAGMEGLEKPMPAAVPAACPVGLRAQHLADGGMVETGSAAPHGIGQRLYLTLTGKPGLQVVSAKVLVRGWTPQGRLQQTLSKQSGSGSGARSLTARFTAGEKNTATATIWAPGLSAVDSVEVLSVSYADGSTWTSGKYLACRVVPDPSMLIADK